MISEAGFAFFSGGALPAAELVSSTVPRMAMAAPARAVEQKNLIRPSVLNSNIVGDKTMDVPHGFLSPIFGNAKKHSPTTGKMETCKW